MSVAELVVTHANGRQETHVLGSQPVVLGRDSSCEIPLDDLSASRRHVRIRFDKGCYILDDLGSKNGTLVNNAPATTTKLNSGDLILIGAVQAIFRDAADAPPNISVVLSDETPRKEVTSYHAATDELQVSHRRLEILYQINDRLTRLRERDELLSEAMDVCFEMLRFERGAIAIRGLDERVVDWPIVRNLRGTEGELKVSRTILSSALIRGERVIVNDADRRTIDPTVSMVQQGIRSAMCVPLLSGEQNLGVIYGDRISTGTTYSKEDIDFLAGIARLVTIGLINCRLLAEHQEKVRLQGELALARKIQTGLFPAQLPNRPDICIAALNDPGQQVSGDYYDVIGLPNGRIAFVIADVSGKGVAAALVMANLQAAVRVTLVEDSTPSALLARWNDLICTNTDGSKFVTCLVGLIDPSARHLELASAGHLLPFVLPQEGRCREIEIEPGLPLGVEPGVRFPSRALTLESGAATVLCYTDGVVEAPNEQGEQFGPDRLAALLNEVAQAAPDQLVRRVRQAVSRHAGAAPQGDDITMLALHLPTIAAE
jgi:phosphoserine phosphatase RsbU/P